MATHNRIISAAELVATELRDMIYHGAVLPGDRLNADSLAAQLSISKTPVRDAIQALRVEGLVEIVPRVGVFVRKMTDQEAEDVYRLKEAVEPLAASLAAARGSQEDRSRLVKLGQKLRTATQRGWVPKAEETVNQIHECLFEMSDSEPLRETFRVINGRVRLLRFQNMAQRGRLEATLAHHEAIIAAVVASDGSAAAERMRSHVQDAWKALQAVIAQEAQARA